jgi:hypothetical protein
MRYNYRPGDEVLVFDGPDTSTALRGTVVAHEHEARCLVEVILPGIVRSVHVFLMKMPWETFLGPRSI